MRSSDGRSRCLGVSQWLDIDRNQAIVGYLSIWMVLTACSLTLVASDQQRQPGTASVRGSVRDAVTGRPVAGAEVTLSAGSMTRGSTTVARSSVRSSSSGEFSFEPVREGSYTLNVVASGFFPGEFGQMWPSGSGRRLTVRSGTPGRSVTLWLWGHATVTGRIIDKDGDPLVGIRVHAYGVDDAAIADAGQDSTDDRGLYRISGLKPGRYILGTVLEFSAMPAQAVAAFESQGKDPKQHALLRALRRAGAPAPTPNDTVVGAWSLQVPYGLNPTGNASTGQFAMYPSKFLPGVDEPGQAAMVALRAGDIHHQVDMMLMETQSVAVSGVAIGPDGPVRFGRVRLMKGDSLGVFSSPLWTVSSCVTNQEGAFQLFGVVPGRYHLAMEVAPAIDPVIVAEKTDEAGVSRGRIRFEPPPASADLYWGSQVIDVLGEGLSGVSLTMSRGAHIAGTVRFDTSTGSPAPGDLRRLRVRIDRVGAESERILVEVDSNARFFSPSLRPGTYLVSVSGGVSGWVLDAVRRGNKDITLSSVETTSTDINDVVIEMTSRYAGIIGKASDHRGIPLREGTVLVFPFDRRTWTSPAVVRSQMLDLPISSEGAFTSPPMRPDEYFAVALTSEVLSTGWQEPEVLARLAGRATRVSVKRGAGTTLQLRLSGPTAR